MIDPNSVSTIRLGQLPSAVISLTDNIPHEVGSDLKRATIEDLSIFISAYIGASDGVGFRAIQVTDGQTLPTTTEQEFILVGKGTYYNVEGGATLVLTEELNAIVSNGTFWFIGVEIPVNVELAGIVQTIREGFTTTTPSEDAVFAALATKVDVNAVGVTGITNIVIASSAANTYELPIGVLVAMVHVAQGFRFPSVHWTQIGTTVTFLGTTTIGKRIDLLTFTL